MTTKEEYPVLMTVTMGEAIALLGIDEHTLACEMSKPYGVSKYDNRAYLPVAGIKTWTKKKARKDLIAILCEDEIRMCGQNLGRVRPQIQENAGTLLGSYIRASF